MKLRTVVVITLLAGMSAQAGKVNVNGKADVLVCLEVGDVSPWTVTQAKKTTTEIFSGINIHLGWVRNGHTCDNVPARTIRVYFTQGGPYTGLSDTLARTTIGDNSRRIDVYFDRIKETVEPRLVPILLGHALAHEIGHLIEGVNHHSEVGVMKAHWTQHDYFDMSDRPLPFAPEDVALIRSALDAHTLRIAATH